MTRTLNRVMSDLDSLGVEVVECKLKASRAIASQDGSVALDSRGLSATELCEILMHESGHFLSGAFYNPHAVYDIKAKAERRAEKAAVRRYIPFREFVSTMQKGLQTPHELAEHYGVTEDAICKAYYYYRDVCGYSFDQGKE